VLPYPAEHRHGLLGRAGPGERVAQRQIGGEQRRPLSGAEGELHPLLVMPDGVRCEPGEPLRHLRRPRPVGPHLVAGQRQLELLQAPLLLAAREQPFGELEVQLRVVGIVEDPALQLDDALRTRGVDREQREIAEWCPRLGPRG
jgi:hypothetical protein